MKKQAIKKPQRMLCYVNFSKDSYYLTDYAHQLSRLIDAELYLLHTVTDIKQAAGFYVPHISTDKLEDEMLNAAKDKMYKMCSNVIGDLDSQYRLIRKGHPIDIINVVIEEKGIDMVVLGHETSRGTLTAFKSDYAEKFLKNPSCPVLVVPFKISL